MYKHFIHFDVFDSDFDSDPIGHQPGVQFQEERLQLAQRALRLLPLLLTVLPFLVHSVIFPLFVLLFVHPGDPGPAVQAGIGSRVVGRKINLHGCLVVECESGHQLLDHVWSLVCQVLPLTRVGRDVEQPDVFEGGGFGGRRDDAFEVPPATREIGKNLRSKCAIIYVQFETVQMGLNVLQYLWGDPVSVTWVSC